MPGPGSELPPNVAKAFADRGIDMSRVRVHYNSPLHAQAYAQGTDIHLAPGQGHRLAHEAWHIVQQRQGRVGDNVRTHIGLSTDPGARAVQCELLAMGTPR